MHEFFASVSGSLLGVVVIGLALAAVWWFRRSEPNVEDEDSYPELPPSEDRGEKTLEE